MDSSTPSDHAGQYDNRAAALATASRAAASIEQARGVLAWRHDLTMDQAGVLLARLAGARRQSTARTARILVREACSRPAVG